MLSFTQALNAKLAIFSPYLNHSITVSSTLFCLSQGKVADFVAEIERTGELAAQQQDSLHVEFYSQRVVQQFDYLKKAIDKLEQTQKQTTPVVYRTSYRFAKSPHNLPPCKRLKEYQKALRALNDKLSWLIEQNYATQDPNHQRHFQLQIQETEYRKQKCLAAIHTLEDMMNKKAGG
ncbi:MAG: primosomal replication protein PriC [Pasteurellaceae bacterium]|nr:primosomal replication protein PriC [Pasteurellaceae bacterium]